jgi:hypothetical protein
MRYLLTLLAFVTLPSYASLWELTIIGTAFLPDGRSGPELVRYRYDTHDIILGAALRFLRSVRRTLHRVMT